MSSMDFNCVPVDHSLFEVRCAAASCRVCSARGLDPLLDLGRMPLSDGLRRKEDLDDEEPRFPLELVFCPECSLVQILETVPPDVLFGEEYPYFSSYSDHLLRHSAQSARMLADELALNRESLVIEVASNDGYMLRNFKAWGIPVLGIDPAKGPVEAARQMGIESMCAFFSPELADQVVDSGRAADLVVANNVLAHATDTIGFVRGIRTLLKPGGLVSFEFPYVRDLIDHMEFDTIYHEHLCYFSVTAAECLLRMNGLMLKRVERLSIHGGSLRLVAGPGATPDASVASILAEERQIGLDRVDYYRGFAARVRALADELKGLIDGLMKEGKRIAAYGAAAKGAILINVVGIDHSHLAYVADRNPHKQGRFMPGSRLPIVDPQAIRDDPPEYLLILAWNLRNEIMDQLFLFKEAGGRFIIPIPRPEII